MTRYFALVRYFVAGVGNLAAPYRVSATEQRASGSPLTAYEGHVWIECFSPAITVGWTCQQMQADFDLAVWEPPAGAQPAASLRSILRRFRAEDLDAILVALNPISGDPTSFDRVTRRKVEAFWAYLTAEPTVDTGDAVLIDKMRELEAIGVLTPSETHLRLGWNDYGTLTPA